MTDTDAKGAAAALFNEAASLYRAGCHREALEVCQRLLAIEPERPDTLALAGMVAFQVGAVAEAATHYAAAIARRPDFTEAHYNLGNALLQLGRGEEAVAAFRCAARLRPELVPSTTISVPRSKRCAASTTPPRPIARR